MTDSNVATIANIYKTESGRVLASLVRILGDFDLAEEAMQDAFAAALEKWPVDGTPQNPTAWLISTAKFKAIDALRRAGRGREILSEQFSDESKANIQSHKWDDNPIEDDQLRLMFFCCHPALPLDSRIALCLRDVCGMKTGEVARAYLLPTETIKKRIARAKALFRQKQINFEIPSAAELNERMNAVLHVIYLIFNEGYSASSGADHIRHELTEEAIFLCRTLLKLTPTPECLGLLALLLLQESRRQARVDAKGDLIRLEEQDRSLWKQELIGEGVQLIRRAIMSGRLGPYTLQAAIASVHALADSVENTQWDLIVGYYDMLLQITPSPIIELHRAIAVGMQVGPAAGLELLDGLAAQENKLQTYHLLHAARADFFLRLGKNDEARHAYQKAIGLAQQEPEQRYLQKQIDLIGN